MQESTPTYPSPARWVEFDPANRSRYLDIAETSARPFRRQDISGVGLDFLIGRFRAGTPNSPTHLAWYLVSGEVSFVSEHHVFSLKPGQMAFSAAGRSHWIISGPAEGTCRGVWCHLSDVVRWAGLRAWGTRVRETAENGILFHLVEAYLRERERPDLSSQQLALHYAESAACLLGRELDFGCRQNASEEWFRCLDQLWSEVDAGLEKPWTTKLLASRLGISEGYCHRLCLERHGCAPMTQVRQLRMNAAMTLLSRTHLTLEAISETVGYSNAYSFSRAFLATVGIRPGTFRDRSV